MSPHLLRRLRTWHRPPPSPRRPCEPSGRWERRGVATLIIAAVLIVVASAIAVVEPRDAHAGRSRADAGCELQRAPRARAKPPVVVPAGFIDCSEQLGNRHLLRVATGMLGGVIGLSDVPGPRDQAGLRQDARVPDLHCRPNVHTTCGDNPSWNPMPTSAACAPMRWRTRCCGSGDRRSDWEIRYLGPQQPNEYYFRCIIGRGERSEPLEFHAPG